jgi:hypothetical protein
MPSPGLTQAPLTTDPVPGDPASDQTQTRRPVSERAPSFRTTARIVGVLYLAGMVVGIGGNILIQSILTAPDLLPTIAASSALLAVGAVCWLATVAGDAAHGVLMFPILRRHSERSAVGYLAARITDAVLIAVMVLLILMQIPIGVEFLKAGSADISYLQALSAVLSQANLYAYEVAMITVGVAGLILCSAFFRSNLIPRPLAAWGLVGYAVILVGSVLQILGSHLNSVQAIPGGLWEVFIGVWLIVKGFNASAITREPPTTSATMPVETSRHVGSAV